MRIDQWDHYSMGTSTYCATVVQTDPSECALPAGVWLTMTHENPMVAWELAREAARRVMLNAAQFGLVDPIRANAALASAGIMPI